MAFYRGAGGVVWEIDTPPEGSHQRERFDQQIANGDLLPLNDKGELEPIGPPVEPEDNRPAGNASREVWAEYAESIGVEVADGATRAEIIDAVG